MSRFFVGCFFCSSNLKVHNKNFFMNILASLYVLNICQYLLLIILY